MKKMSLWDFKIYCDKLLPNKFTLLQKEYMSRSGTNEMTDYDISSMSLRVSFTSMMVFLQPDALIFKDGTNVVSMYNIKEIRINDKIPSTIGTYFTVVCAHPTIPGNEWCYEMAAK